MRPQEVTFTLASRSEARSWHCFLSLCSILSRVEGLLYPHHNQLALHIPKDAYSTAQHPEPGGTTTTAAAKAWGGGSSHHTSLFYPVLCACPFGSPSDTPQQSPHKALTEGTWWGHHTRKHPTTLHMLSSSTNTASGPTKELPLS